MLRIPKIAIATTPTNDTDTLTVIALAADDKNVALVMVSAAPVVLHIHHVLFQ